MPRAKRLGSPRADLHNPLLRTHTILRIDAARMRCLHIATCCAVSLLLQALVAVAFLQHSAGDGEVVALSGIYGKTVISIQPERDGVPVRACVSACRGPFEGSYEQERQTPADGSSFILSSKI